MKESQLPCCAGVGFKPQHFTEIILGRQPVGFFEVHAENYMGAGGPPHAHLGRLRDDYALSIHGVGLSIGSMGELDERHLSRVKALCDRYEPESFSEHLAWSSHNSQFLNDLLPLPYTAATLQQVVEHIDLVQNVLGRQMLLENPATYLLFDESTWAETDFLAEIARRTGCGLLLDVNNVFVASTNHNLDPAEYLTAFPVVAVREVHLGGHAATTDDEGAPLLIDSHDAPVADEVWGLYESLIHKIGATPTLIEWDHAVPEWAVLCDEVRAVDQILLKTSANRLAWA